jgi:hypothetical protein
MWAKLAATSDCMFFFGFFFVFVSFFKQALKLVRILVMTSPCDTEVVRRYGDGDRTFRNNDALAMLRNPGGKTWN